MRPLNKILILSIRFYQKRISAVTASRCIFTPSCSSYAIEALKKRGFFVAVFLIIKRLVRCNPLSCGGFDPVPDGKRKLKWLV